MSDVNLATGLAAAEAAVEEMRREGFVDLPTVLSQATGGRSYILFPRTLAANVDMGDGSNALDRITLLERGLAGNTTSFIVENIAERDRITGKIPGDKCYVIDATADPTVSEGGATYIWMPAKDTEAPYWRKLGEDESQDFVLDWDNIHNRPASSPGDIDAAVSQAHGHSNRPLLDALSTDAENRLCLNGRPVDDNRREVEFASPFGPLPDALRDGGMLVVLEE